MLQDENVGACFLLFFMFFYFSSSSPLFVFKGLKLVTWSAVTLLKNLGFGGAFLGEVVLQSC